MKVPTNSAVIVLSPIAEKIGVDDVFRASLIRNRAVLEELAKH